MNEIYLILKEMKVFSILAFIGFLTLFIVCLNGLENFHFMDGFYSNSIFQNLKMYFFQISHRFRKKYKLSLIGGAIPYLAAYVLLSPIFLPAFITYNLFCKSTRILKRLIVNAINFAKNFYLSTFAEKSQVADDEIVE